MDKSWFKLKKGWLRLHLVFTVLYIIFLSIYLESEEPHVDIVFLWCLTVPFYWVIIYLIKWIKEGFENQ